MHVKQKAGSDVQVLRHVVTKYFEIYCYANFNYLGKGNNRAIRRV